MTIREHKKLWELTNIDDWQKLRLSQEEILSNFKLFFENFKIEKWVYLIKSKKLIGRISLLEGWFFFGSSDYDRKRTDIVFLKKIDEIIVNEL